MRFVGRLAFIEPVDLEMFMVLVWAALEASLRKFDVLQFMSVAGTIIWWKLRSYCVRHVDDTSRKVKLEVYISRARSGFLSLLSSRPHCLVFFERM